MTAWLWAALLGAIGSLAAVIQQLRVAAAKAEVADLRKSVETHEKARNEWEKAYHVDTARLEALLTHRETQLQELEDVCRENNAPDAVRARLRLLLNPADTARPAAAQLRLDLTTSGAGGTGGGGK